MLENIPMEMRAYPQWITWRLELKKGAPSGTKPTKIPYNPKTGELASVSDPATWLTFGEVCTARLDSVLAVDPGASVWATGFSGIGFVFTDNDPFAGIDLDDAHGDAPVFADQQDIYRQFNSYSELSPSGNGLHIIIKGRIEGQGRRRFFVETYSTGRYFTMTGNVLNPAPIAERQELLDELVKHLGKPPVEYPVGIDKPETQTDAQIVDMASNAVNGEKFKALYHANLKVGIDGYPSQSEADFALVDIVAFYTQNRKQIARIFRASSLGKRDKAKRDQYIKYMVDKSYDRQLPPIDIEGWLLKFAAKFDGAAGARGEKPGGNSPLDLCEGSAGETAIHDARNGSHSEPEKTIVFPPGLLGDIAAFILAAAPRPVPIIALAGAIAVMSGITGRAYNVNGIGLNQYVIMLGRTGVGKDAIADGASKLLSAVQLTVPSVIDFQGPGELVSSAGLIKWLQSKPCCFSVVGEIGLKLREMSSPGAPPHMQAMQRTLTQMYSKSGQGKFFDPFAYSDTAKNGVRLSSPAYTLIGEGVPETFYGYLSEELVASGLLPRFMVLEYLGERQELNEGAMFVKPSISLVQKMADVTAQCLNLTAINNVQNVVLNATATDLFKKFDSWTTKIMNADNRQITAELWNRAHIKALKLAAVCAVGINYINPIITEHEADWAIELIVAQTQTMLDKFLNFEIGMITGTESDQLKSITKTITSYMTSEYDRYSKYGGTKEMHRDRVITHDHISRRMIDTAAFRHDRMGANNAIKKIIAMMIDNADLLEIPKAQMKQTYGKASRAYCIGDAGIFN